MTFSPQNKTQDHRRYLRRILVVVAYGKLIRSKYNNTFVGLLPAEAAGGFSQDPPVF